MSKKYLYSSNVSPRDSKLTPYSHSILTAACTCPMWGVIHYGLRRKYETDARAMALEYGGAAHECFAAIYLYQLGFIQGLKDHMMFHAERIFKDKSRFRNALKTVDKDPDLADALASVAINILHSGEFYDDPHDNIRTVANLELGIIHYIDNIVNDLPRWPIWVSDRKEPTKPVGIELPFDMELNRTLIKSSKKGIEQNDSQAEEAVEARKVRYIGQIDRLHEIERQEKAGKSSTKHLVLGENKTGSRLDTAWQLSFDTSHQLTGYLLAVYTVLQRSCIKSRVHGLKVKASGSSDDFEPISPAERNAEMFEAFIDWAVYASDIYETYVSNFEAAPRFTHSCNRYFRPCSLIPFCSDTAEGREEQVKQMIESELSPSEQAVLDGIGLIE